MDLANNRIKRERLRRGWSQEKLAEIAGVDQRDISYAENGKLTGITLVKAAKIANALGKPIEYIWPDLLD